MATDPIWFDCASEDILLGKHKFGVDEFKVALTNVAPDNDHTEFSDLTEIAEGNGYTAGGEVTVSTVTRVGSTSRVFFADTTFAATGVMAGFRYASVYNNTHEDKPLLFRFDYGSTRNLGATDGFVVDFDSVLGALAIKIGEPE